MVDGIKDGAAPKSVTTYMEEEARLAFEGDRATFMRNWPYAYAAGKKNKKAPDFEVAPFPPFEGGGKAGILGGHNDVISVNGKNPGGSIKVLEYLSSEAEHKIARQRVLAAAGDRVGLRRPGGQEGAAVRGRAQAGDLPGEVPPGVAGLPADLCGDLQERQRGALGRRDAGGGARRRVRRRWNRH